MMQDKQENFLIEFEKEMEELYNSPDSIANYVLFWIIIFMLTFSKEIENVISSVF